MNRIATIAPFLAPLAFLLVLLFVYSVRVAIGRTPEVSGVGRRKYTELFGPYLQRYMLWILQPIERLVLWSRVSPNFVTLLGLLACVGSGMAAATQHLSTAAWLYVGSGALDILDGRLARATGRSSPAGAFLDSVVDRWGELFALTGFAWMLRGSWALLAVILALAGSLMVSYTRARAEGLGIQADGGTMQRAERIFLVSLASLVAACVHAQPDTAVYTHHVLGVGLLMTGLFTTATAIGRLAAGYRALSELERERERERGARDQQVRRAS